MSEALASHASSSSPAAAAASFSPPSPMSEIAQRPRPHGGASTTNTSAPPSTVTRDRSTSQGGDGDDGLDNAIGAGAGVEPLPVAIIKGTVDKQSLSYLWRSGVAGGLAGCAAKTVVAPLDRVKILFQASNPVFAQYSGSWAGVAQTMRLIYQQDGFVGLYRGHSATLLRVFPYAAVKFLAYEQIRSFIIPRKENETPLRRLLSGSLAGVTSVFFTYPLEVVRVRLAFETRRDAHSSLVSICRRIYYEQAADRTATAVAMASAKKAAKASASGQAPAAAASTSTAASAAAASSASSAAATAAVTPPAAAAPKLHSYGFINFYRGFSPTILGMLPYAGMSFLTHDTCGDLLRHPMVSQWTTLPADASAPPGKPLPLRSWAELLAGGIAGMVSQSASYPLEVIRRRMQVGGAVGDGHRLGIGETARLIIQERGFRGFFVGLTIGYVKIVPMSATAFFTYERLKRYYGI